MEFRELSAIHDETQIARYLERLYSELFGPEQILSEAEFQTACEEWQRHRHAHWAFEAMDETGRVTAFFTLVESFAFFAHGTYGILNELWVHPAARSQGVGDKVISFCSRFGEKRGWRRLDVSAPQSTRWDRTYAFYQKRGFVPTGRKLRYLISDHQDLDDGRS